MFENKMKASNSQFINKFLSKRGTDRISLALVATLLCIVFVHFNKLIEFITAKQCETERDIFNSDLKCYQDDPVVLSYIRKFHLFPPSNKKYNLSREVQGLERSVKQTLKKVFGSNFQESGFFVECGANDGEFLSNTIEFEATYGWNGLLIEASPSLFREMKTKNRKAWLSDICLSSELPEQIEFTRHKDAFPEWKIGVGRVNPEKTKERTLINPGWSKEDFTSEGVVECFSLYSVLKALNMDTVDFFSLDVEGHELQILKAIPYNLLNIKAIFVESRGHTTEDKLSMKNLLEDNGYFLALDTGTDYLFVKPNH